MKEDIKNLEEIINLCKEEINNNDKNITATLDLEDLKSLEKLLTRYKELEEWKKEKGCSIQEVFELFIPKSKVKEKIEELDERIKNPERTSYWASYTISECIGIRRILQDLLGEE